MTTGSTVSEYMTPHPLVLASSDTAASARETFVENRFTLAPVVDPEGRCVGVVSASDLLRHYKDDPSQTLAAIMSVDLVHVRPDAEIEEAAGVLAGAGVHHALVLDTAGIPVGVLSTLDVALALAHSDLLQPAEWIMSSEVVELDAGMSVGEARGVLEDAGVSSAPIVIGGRVRGFVSQLAMLDEKVDDDDRVDQIMEGAKGVHLDTPIRSIARLFGEDGIRHVYVKDEDEELVGIVSSTDIVRFVASLYEPEGSNDGEDGEGDRDDEDGEVTDA